MSRNTIAVAPPASRGVDLGWHASCAPSGWVDFPETCSGFPLSAAGRFGDAFTQRYPRDDGTGENAYDYDLRGTVKRTSARGTFQAKLTFAEGDTCDTERLSWKATST